MGLNLPSGKLSIKTYSSQFLGFTIWNLAYLLHDILALCIFLVDFQLGPEIVENINQIHKNHLSLQKRLNIDLKNFFLLFHLHLDKSLNIKI